MIYKNKNKIYVYVRTRVFRFQIDINKRHIKYNFYVKLYL